jgi:hypothetical protein
MERTRVSGWRFASGALLPLLLAGMPGAASGNPLVDAIRASRPLLDARLRFEHVEQPPFTEDADALTLRTRLGFETGKAWDTTLLVEGEANLALTDDYNGTTNGRTQFPVVADPENTELNRLHLTNTSFDATTITLGRQRIVLDDHRFVGNVGWRQNEQTFDALRVVNRSIRNVTVDVSFVNQVNRVFGKDGRPGANDGSFHGDTVLANLAVVTPLGRLTGFAYLISFDETPLPVRDSSQTYGLRLAGDRALGAIRLGYVASWATQSDYRSNPVDYGADYWLGELTASWRAFSVGAGYEVLEGDGIKGFTTPLATLHRFQGWTDKFVATPAEGIDDRYVNFGWQAKGMAGFDTLAAQATWHDYRGERLAIDYGSELNLQVQARVRRLTGTLKYAAYHAASLTPAPLRDTDKLWVQLEFAW